jgi:hypothetical protein
MSVLYNLYRLSSQEGTIVVKCHWSSNPVLEFFCKHTKTKMTLIYRDPRDIILSMIDHGNRTRQSDAPNGPFSNCYDVVDLIPLTVKMMKRLQLWQSKDYIYCIKYEEFITDKYNILQEMNAFLKWKIQDYDLQQIIETHERSKETTHNFNKGISERWRYEMNEVQKQACLKAFEPYLKQFNYSLA